MRATQSVDTRRRRAISFLGKHASTGEVIVQMSDIAEALKATSIYLVPYIAAYFVRIVSGYEEESDNIRQ